MGFVEDNDGRAMFGGEEFVQGRADARDEAGLAEGGSTPSCSRRSRYSRVMPVVGLARYTPNEVNFSFSCWPNSGILDYSLDCGMVPYDQQRIHP